METIPKTDCEKIGFFRKTHGVRGDMVLEFEPHFEYSVEDANRFFVEIEGLLVPFFVVEEGFRFKTGNTAIITLDGVDDEKYARRLVSQQVYLFKNEIVATNEGEFDTSLINYLLIDSNIGELGIIDQIDDYAGNIVITVNYRGQELLVPYNEDFIIEIDDNQKTIKLNLPEGLIDL
jgi:16S rRNA processing protein RimM